MRDNLFDRVYKNKSGAIDYDRISKIKGISKSDLIFLIRGDFNLLDRAYLISGVLVGYHPVVENGLFPSRWDLRTCYNSPEDLAYISKLISNHGKDFNLPYEYFVMDSRGGLLSANCKVTSKANDQGVMHIESADESLDHFVYPATLKQCSYKCFYCHNEDMGKLNKQIQSYSDQKLIEKPSDFKSGFTPPNQVEERQQ